jgi:ESCRT-II complex subunit VPS25
MGIFKVDETAQKNTVLTLYELIEGDMTKSQGKLKHRDWGFRKANYLLEFHGMDAELLQKSLAVMVKRGKAQVFGSDDQQGVKFF